MKLRTVSVLGLAVLLPGLVGSSCFGGGGGGTSGGSSSRMRVLSASNGFGQMLPHRVFQLDDAGQPTNRVIEITRVDQIVDNATLTNPIFSPTEWPATATLPNGEQGNHFFYVRFSRPLDITSVLEPSTGGGVNNNLTGTITVLAVDPDNPTQLLLEQWVVLDGNGKPVANGAIAGSPGVGFPGTQSVNGFAGASELVDPRTFVFIPDSDGSMATHETFPVGVQIRMRITRQVASVSGAGLEEGALASTTVGEDKVCPEVAVSGQTQIPVIIPGNGEVDIDPETSVIVEFSEPIQIRTIGEMDFTKPATQSAAVQLQFGPSTAVVNVPYHVRLLSPYDLSRVELVPVFAFPGSGPTLGGLTCGNFSQVTVVVNANQFMDLSSPGNTNTLNAQTFFVTREGPGLVNAPVVPDAIYVARGGSNPGVSVIDLNGFGASTGNPIHDVLNPVTQGNSNYPNNPNVALQGSALIPPLVPGACTFDGGSEGVFSVTKDSSLRDLLIGMPLIQSAGDMALGHALDGTFNNSTPNGCQSGGGNICATNGFKIINIGGGGASTVAPVVPTLTGGQLIFKSEVGGENVVSWAPHPNPPPLRFPPLCLDPLIGGQEPTSILAITPGGLFDPLGLGLSNLLGPGGNPLGNPATDDPPDGLLSTEQNSYFIGPAPPGQMITSCRPFMVRQQIGHFLYVVDRAAAEVVVVNSNRFSVIDRIRLPDPTGLAMSPNLDFLAVTNQGADIVSIIDIDPNSTTLHQVVKQVPVGSDPTGIAWDPTNEDIFVCNSGDSSVSVISVFTLNVRKILRNQINGPIDVAITPRQDLFGFMRFTYFGYILNRDGSVALFESGPDGVNGWGFDDVIGRAPFTFFNPKAIQPDIRNLNSAVWVVHEKQLGPDGNPTGLEGGAVSNLALSSGTRAPVPLDLGPSAQPHLRDLGFRVLASIGSDQLTGIPVDLAFDNQRNQSAFTNHRTQFSAGTPLSLNGKNLVRSDRNTFQFTQVSTPQFMFLAVPNSTQGPGVVDVISLGSGFQRFDTNPYDSGVQSIPVANVLGVVDYFRQ